jgi:hypothetical protein
LLAVGIETEYGTNKDPEKLEPLAEQLKQMIDQYVQEMINESNSAREHSDRL